MSLEDKIDSLIASLDKNTAALSHGFSPATSAPVTKPAKPAKPVKVKEIEEPALVPEEAVPTADTVSSVIESLLKANKRHEAIGLLKKYNAKSASGVTDDDAEAFIADAQSVLLGA
jgi:hypothetical protein